MSSQTINIASNDQAEFNGHLEAWRQVRRTIFKHKPKLIEWKFSQTDSENCAFLPPTHYLKTLEKYCSHFR